MAYAEWLRLPEAQQPTALAAAAALYSPLQPPVIVHSLVVKRVFETPELVQLIVTGLQLADIALVALQVNRTFREAARGRVAALWPKVSQLLAAPFNLSRRDLLHMVNLRLTSKGLGDTGCAALAEACAMGALAHLEGLVLDDNQIGDDGGIALADACAKGALANLQTLSFGEVFGGNNIGDEGIKALADVCAEGALASLKELRLNDNKIGDPGLASLADACAKGALAQLTRLDLDQNEIGDSGVKALADACAKGAMASLKDLYVPSPHEENARLKAACQAQSINLH